MWTSYTRPSSLLRSAHNEQRRRAWCGVGSRSKEDGLTEVAVLIEEKAVMDDTFVEGA